MGFDDLDSFEDLSNNIKQDLTQFEK